MKVLQTLRLQALDCKCATPQAFCCLWSCSYPLRGCFKTLKL
jgi:hypothetical protein